MTVYETIQSRRSIRKFTEEEPKKEDLRTIIDSARLAPTAMNLQPLKYGLITDSNVRQQLFPLITYAGAWPQWNPTFAQSPKAFVVVLNDTTIKPSDKSECDCGAAVQNMCLTAKSLGLDTIWLAAINRPAIREVLALEERYDIMYLLGIGYGAQTGVVFTNDDGVKYHFDEADNLHVPRRSMDAVLLWEI